LVEPLADLTAAPVRMRNDAVAAVGGEQRFADAPANTVYLMLSSGVGAGACVDGHVLSGWRGNAAEVGHLVVDSSVNDFRCGCGGQGHWEGFVGGANPPDYARHVHERQGVEIKVALDSMDAATVFPGDRASNPLCALIVDRVARWDTLGVAALVHAYAPGVVSVGGTVALANATRVLDPVRERPPGNLATEPPALPTTMLGDDVVLFGALALVVPDP
jgi:glucokinase